MAGSIAERLREVAERLEATFHDWPLHATAEECSYTGCDMAGVCAETRKLEPLEAAIRSLAGEIEETSKYLRDAAGNTLRLDDLRALPNKVEYVASRLAAPEEK